ncbi:MAG: hypothetical protein Unbinned8210contig1002_7 [Prokaryotic dsDNA virus sp.]|nr:MAG: hypothetical protein Unbinned8210contig1002_7 [Prokaryotic dsDNA virus sp.]|tara:strand:+ start:6144 stop:9365 length:3222 start_codon:yes stop_codon:yes gene_type:complete
MITIRLVDYKYRKNSTGYFENLINMQNVTSLTSYATIHSQTTINFDNTTGSTKYVTPISGPLSKGNQYELKVKIENHSGGNIGFSQVLADGTVDLPNDARGSADGTFTGSAFTAHANSGVKAFAAANTSGKATFFLVQRQAIERYRSYIGDLDVGKSEDFPLSLNFSIADVRNLDSRTGTYSKTFNIPATKNNNKILKGIYKDGAIVGRYNAGEDVLQNPVATKKDCIVNIDDLYSISGKLEITAVGNTDTPQYYSCVFYGNNSDWAFSLENRLLKDLSVADSIDPSTGEIVQGAAGSGWDNLNGHGTDTGKNLPLTYDAILDAFEVDDAQNKTPYNQATVSNPLPVVYPNVGYGERNEGGTCATQQLLKTADAANGWGAAYTGCFGFNNSGNAYGNPTPTVDWRPGIFIYDIIHQIFKQIGYKLSSTFIETAMFKKFIMILPNFTYNNSEDRLADYSIGGRFDDSGTPSTPGKIRSVSQTYSNYTQNQEAWPAFYVKWNEEGNYNASNLYTNVGWDSNGIYTIPEAGFYDITSTNIGINVDDVCYAGGSTQTLKIHYARLQFDVRTVGNPTNYKTLTSVGGAIADNISITCPGNVTSPNQYMGTFEDIEISQRYFNKGDKIRFRVKIKISHTNSGTQDIGVGISMWGGNPQAYSASSASSDATGSVDVRFSAEEAAWQQEYDLKHVIDNEQTQLGFLKGVIQAFNLYADTDVDSKIVTLEPFYYAGDDRADAGITDFFENQNTALDWTSKVDYTKNIEDKFLETTLTNELIFKFKEDSNNKKVADRGRRYWDGIPDEYPHKEIVGGDAKKGVTNFENPFFSSTYNSHDGMIGGSTVCSAGACAWVPTSAVLWGECDTSPPTLPTSCSGCRPPKGNNFQPSLLNYVKEGYERRPMGTDVMQWKTRIQTWGTSERWLTSGIPELDTSGNIATYYATLCRATSYDDRRPYNNAGAGNPSETPPVLVFASPRLGQYNHLSPNSNYMLQYVKGLYQTYYQVMIEMLKKDSKIKELHINLNMSDIVSLNLRKLVYIDGYYYRINRIVDFQPGKNQSTKVELILWEEVGVYPAAAGGNF